MDRLRTLQIQQPHHKHQGKAGANPQSHVLGMRAYDSGAELKTPDEGKGKRKKFSLIPSRQGFVPGFGVFNAYLWIFPLANYPNEAGVTLAGHLRAFRDPAWLCAGRGRKKSRRDQSARVQRAIPVPEQPKASSSLPPRKPNFCV